MIKEAARNGDTDTLQKLTNNGVDITGILTGVSMYIAIQIE